MSKRKVIVFSLARASEEEILTINKWTHSQYQTSRSVFIILSYFIDRFGMKDVFSDDIHSALFQYSTTDALFNKMIGQQECTDFTDMKVTNTISISLTSLPETESDKINMWLDEQKNSVSSFRMVVKFFVSHFGYIDVSKFTIQKYLYLGLHYDLLVSKQLLSINDVEKYYTAEGEINAATTQTMIPPNSSKNTSVADSQTTPVTSEPPFPSTPSGKSETLPDPDSKESDKKESDDGDKPLGLNLANFNL